MLTKNETLALFTPIINNSDYDINVERISNELMEKEVKKLSFFKRRKVSRMLKKSRNLTQFLGSLQSYLDEIWDEIEYKEVLWLLSKMLIVVDILIFERDFFSVDG